MTTYFITRHHGAAQWALAQGIHAQILSHLNVETLQAGDQVLGTLPVHLAAEVCARGAAYLHLSINVPEPMRGKELSADQMREYGARLEEFKVEKV